MGYVVGTCSGDDCQSSQSTSKYGRACEYSKTRSVVHQIEKLVAGINERATMIYHHPFLPENSGIAWPTIERGLKYIDGATECETR